MCEGPNKSKAILDQINDVKSKISERKDNIQQLIKSIKQIHSDAINATYSTE